MKKAERLLRTLKGMSSRTSLSMKTIKRPIKQRTITPQNENYKKPKTSTWKLRNKQGVSQLLR